MAEDQERRQECGRHLDLPGRVLALVLLVGSALCGCGDEAQVGDSSRPAVEPVHAATEGTRFEALPGGPVRVVIAPTLEIQKLDSVDMDLGILLRLSDSEGDAAYDLRLRVTARRPDLSADSVYFGMAWLSGDWWDGLLDTYLAGDVTTMGWSESSQSRFLSLPAVVPMDLTLVRREGTTETLLSPDDVLELWGGTGGAGMDRLGWIGVRCNLRGSRPRIGARETEFRFDWWSESHGYHIALRVNDEGFQRWGGALRSTLESIEWP